MSRRVKSRSAPSARSMSVATTASIPTEASGRYIGSRPDGKNSGFKSLLSNDASATVWAPLVKKGDVNDDVGWVRYRLSRRLGLLLPFGVAVAAAASVL